MPILYQRRKRAEDAPRGQINKRIEQDYDVETVRDAVQAALDVGRPDLAQQIVDYSGCDLCVLCVDVHAIDIMETPHGPLQLCENCGMEFQSL